MIRIIAGKLAKKKNPFCPFPVVVKTGTRFMKSNLEVGVNNCKCVHIL